MALPVQQQAKYWGITTAIIALALWFLGDVILPFVLGGAIAYCLDPIADWFESKGLSRILSVVLITLIAVFIFVLMFLLVIPSLIEQTWALINSAPELFGRLQEWLSTKFPQIMDEGSTARAQLVAVGEAIQSKGGDLFNGLVSSALSLINILVLIVIVPVVTFYLLLDWDNMVARIDDLLPRDHAPAIRRIATDVDRTLASFIRGQGTVCIILGTYYAIGLMLVGLKFGLVVGFIAGLITFIPYVGALIGGALAVGLALFQYWGAVEVVEADTVSYTTDWLRIGLVAAIFGLGQFLEGNILTPNLVGNSVGLHPVWLIFALSVFGALFGFVGMLVAVPLAAMIGVVARFGISQYKDGRLYQGLSGKDAE